MAESSGIPSEPPKKKINFLTEEEKKFILEKSLDADWTDIKIAKALNRSIDSVKNWRKRNNIYKSMDGGLIAQSLPPESINKSSLSKADKIKAWERIFKESDRYSRLRDQLTAKDLKSFTERWAAYCVQFDDLKPAEESQLETLITYELRMDDLRRSYKAAQMNEDELRKKMGSKSEKDFDLEKEEDRWMWEMIESNNRNMLEINKMFTELTKHCNTYFEALNSTRQQREMKENIGAEKFIDLVKNFTDIERRKQAGQYNELMKMATKKKTKELKTNHHFGDADVAPIILDGKDYKKEHK